MTVHIALLRAVNVGGRSRVAMAGLREVVQDMGLCDVRSLLQSGNLVFCCAAPTPVRLERLLEAETERRLGLRTQFFVRSAKQWSAALAANPFRAEARQSPGRLVLMALKDAPAARSVRDLRIAISGPERIHVAGRQAYIAYPDGIGRSRLTGNFIETRLGTRGTGRNWNTVVKLAALASS
jgi:uncharacterized protein (DUF1697 family)